MAKAVRSKAVSSTSGKGKAPTPKAGVASTTKASTPKKGVVKPAPSISKKAQPAVPKKISTTSPAKTAKAVVTGKAKAKPLAPTASATKKAVAPKKATSPEKATTAKAPVAKKAAKAGVKSSVQVVPKKAAPEKPVAIKKTSKKATSTKAAPKKATVKQPALQVEKTSEEVAVLPAKDLGKPMEPYRARRVLITLPQPEGDKSPYFDFAKKQDLTIDFFPFISVEGLTGKEFRQQKIDFNLYTAVVFTSRLAVDHFFRIMEEVRVKVSQDLKYFCITEAVALYLQKFIMYRKRKVFFSADGSTQGLLDVIGKHKQERYMVSTADGVKKEIPAFLKKYKIVFAEASLYRTVSNNISPAMAETRYDMILFFSPYSVQALFEQAPGYQQRDTVVGAFGPSTAQAVEEAGLRLDIKAPAPQMPSMVAALEHFFEGKK